jgi:hypothetical protein
MIKDDLKKEIILCGRDPIYFIKRYVKIKHPKRGLIPFQTFTYQEELIRGYQQNRFNVILKARQLGISEITAAYACWLMLFHRDKNILVMATKSETAKNIIKKVATALKKIPKWLLLADITTDNKLSIELSNGSQIKAIATSDDAGRSEALSLLIIDEAAFIKNLDELWTGLFPTINAGGSIVVLSTPNGVGNKFHQIYTEAVAGTNEFKFSKLMWWVHPEHISDLEDDEARPGFKTSSWYRAEIKSSNYGPREIAQELECNFNASGDTVIAADGIKWIEESCIDPSYREHWDRNEFIWFRPERDERYLLTADVARGDSSDNSAAGVFRISDMSEVAEYYGKIPPEEFADVICDLGKRYNDAIVVVENNNIGMTCLEHIRLNEYKAVYYSRRGDMKPGEIVNLSWGKPELDSELIPGFTTNQKNRPLIIAKLEEYIRNRNMNIRSKRFLYEIKTFVWSSGRAAAMNGRNDDLVMMTALAAWIKDTFLIPRTANVDVQKNIIDGISIVHRDNTQIEGASKDPRFISKTGANSLARQNHQLKLPGNITLDLSWLMSTG